MSRSHPLSGFRPLATVALAIVLAGVAAGCGSNNATGSPRAGVLAATNAPQSAGAANGGGGAGSGGSGSSGQAGGQAGQSSGTGVNDGAPALETQMVSVIRKVNPSVVLIETASGLGSGVVYDANGDIVTNAHVAGSDSSFKVTFADGHSTSGSLVGSYQPDDIAVIRVKTAVTPATFGDSSKLAVGDIVLAMGNPLGLQSSVTQGIVSALGRSVSEPGGNALPDVIQTSAPINPGNSGGALVDLAGEVVGIPTLAATDPQLGGAASGIGFAISSNRARLIADQLIGSGHVTSSGRAYLGLQLADTNGQGVLVYSVVANGPSAKAGVQAGDVITALNGQQIASVSDLQAVMAKLHPGDQAKLDLVRQDGSRASVTVTLGQTPG